jgi:hypothetical protein
MTKSVTRFTMAALLVGALALGPVAWLGGSPLLIQAATAYALTALPALFTFVLTSWAFATAPDLRMLASQAGSMIRLMLALGGGIVLALLADRETFATAAFWLWLAGFYLVFLTLEITLLVRAPLPTQAGPGTGGREP